MASRVTIVSPRARRTSAEKMGSSRKQPNTVEQQRRVRKIRQSKEEAKWKVEETWAPPRRLSDHELSVARRMFFELDKDGSGSIDHLELGVMMRSLGQSPTEAELKLLIKSVDSGDEDGEIQFREFLTLYTRGLDTKNKPGASDVQDTFAAMGGDPRDKDATVSAERIREFMMAEYDLDVDLFETFGITGTEITKDDLEALLLATGKSRPASPRNGAVFAANIS